MGFFPNFLVKSNRPLLVVMIILSVLPLMPGVPIFWLTLLNNVGLASLVAIGLVLLTGVGGLTSFGQAAFCGFGAYTTAVLTTRYGLSPWATLPLSLAVCGGAALLLGLVTVRLSGHYLPLGTIAWGISLYYLFGKIELLGRNDGISGIPPLSFFGTALIRPEQVYYVIWIFVFIAAFATLNLLDSRIGRAIRALRRGQMAAEAFGIDAPRMKLIVFVYAGLLAGLSGWLYAHIQRSVNPTPFGLSAGIEYLFMSVLGGAGQIWGALLGAGLVVLLKDVLQRFLPALVGNQYQVEGIVFGIILVLLLQVARDGLWARIRTFFAPAPDRVIGKSSLPARLESDGQQFLRVTDVRKTFGGLVAVNNVSFEVKGGEIRALIGPNGAGKSTIFNLITGVLQLTSGGVQFGGTTISGQAAKFIAKQGIARTFQHIKLLPDMTVLENVAIGAHLRGRAGLVPSILRLERREEFQLLAEAAKQIERVGLSSQMMKTAGSLALGQQRIVEIARALCMEPRLLLLDEPAAGLRHLEKQALSKLLSQLRAEGMAILLVEHDMGFVMGLTDNITVIDFGTKIAEGTPAEIKVHPAVLAAYLGSAA